MTDSRVKRHRRSLRLSGYDYTQPGAYFITVCTHHRECLFGEVINGEMRLNECGHVVETEWVKTADTRSNVELDAFVVMPNHFHGILVIVDGDDGTARRAPTMERFGKTTVGSLPTIVRAFKSAVSKRINELCGKPGAPAWQRNYYEHVIRSEVDLAETRGYVANNPLKWELDSENPNNQSLGGE